jgi:hypothetical protein
MEGKANKRTDDPRPQESHIRPFTCLALSAPARQFPT